MCGLDSPERGDLLTALKPGEERTVRARDEAQPPVDLRHYDYIVVSTSAGKDSLAMLDYVCELAEGQGVLDRVIAVHADLGRVEWPGVPELARRQAERYGIRFEIVTRQGGVASGRSPHAVPCYEQGEPYGDLLDHYWHRLRQMQKLDRKVPVWPDMATRYCTADHKRQPILRFITALAAEFKREHGASRPARILDCEGCRAQESRKRTRNQHVYQWLPVKWWSVADVWERIRSRGLEHHPAYDMGMPRLSCVFCVFASRQALLVAGYHNPELLREHVELERAIERWSGYTFRKGFRLADIAEGLDRGAKPPKAIEDWAA